MPVKQLRSAIETVEPTTCSICAVSDVSRLAISDGRFSSKKRGVSVSRWACTSVRMSATVRSPSHADEIEADRGGDGEHRDDHQQVMERLGDAPDVTRTGAGAEPAVDDPLEAIRDRDRRRRRDDQCGAGDGDPARDIWRRAATPCRGRRSGCGGAGRRCRGRPWRRLAGGGGRSTAAASYAACRH